MDNNPPAQQQFSTNNQLAASGSSYPSPSAIAPHQLQQGSSTQQHTLPPLQHNNNNSMQPGIYGSHPHTPRTPGTPSTPQPQTNMSNYPPPNAAPGRASYSMMPAQYQNPPQGYPTTTSMMPQASVATTHPQPIAPAPAAVRPPVLRPMPAGGVIPQSGMSSPYAGSPMMGHQPNLVQDTEQPTHVVGSQGRRGILPSAPGRPAAPTGTGASKNTVIPQKDADGKFPCPHCTKTYLHAKHLKRHLLRHTGDRPYMCVLCRDTFSRSDILKRHFQKCSIRRGNPTGASHLSHPQAHVKKQQQNAQKANEGDLGHINGMTNMPGEPVVHPFGMVQIQDGIGSMANDQNQLSRSSSMSRMDDAANRDRRNMPAAYNGEVSNSMSSNINPQLANFNMPPNQNGAGMPLYGASGSNQQSGLDWSQMFQQPGAHQHVYNTTFPSPNIGQNQTVIKTEPNLPSERSNGTPGAPPTDGIACPIFTSNWEPQVSMQDGCQQLFTQITNFFYPSGTYVRPENNAILHFFHPDNINTFLQSFSHFHAHFSFIHRPTFRIMETYPGLIAAMCCTGACYSNRVDPVHVREVITFLNIALERDCALAESQPLFKVENSTDKLGFEKLQALTLMSCLLIWNGTPIQREIARRLFPAVAAIVRSSDLLQVQKESNSRSLLHNPDLDLQAINSQPFDWVAWVEQEKRIRLMHMVHLLDVARGLYFNLDAQFNPFEISIPLPADDAAWEAQSGEECAGALGLFGPDAVKKVNPEGSQRSKQPELNLILQATLDASVQIQPGSTNIWGKYILMHSLLAVIRRAQLEGGLAGLTGSLLPLRPSDWMVMGSSDTNNTDAGSENPEVAAISGSQPILSDVYSSFSAILDKWKSSWDMDMAIQFPPSVSSASRFGFRRDGPQLFWLAKLFLKAPRLNVIQMGPDQRLTQVLQLLKTAAACVETNGASLSEDLNSVGVMNTDYAVSNLILSLAQFFKPLPSLSESLSTPGSKT